MKQTAIALIFIFISLTGFGQTTTKHEDFVYKGVAYLKNERLLRDYSQSDTIFIALKGIDESRHNYYFVGEKLMPTTALTICDENRARNGCLIFYFGLVNKNKIEFRFVHGSIWDGIFKIEDSPNAYFIKDFSFIKFDY